MKKPQITVKNGDTFYDLCTIAKQHKMAYMTVYMRYRTLRKKEIPITVKSLTEKITLGRPKIHTGDKIFKKTVSKKKIKKEVLSVTSEVPPEVTPEISEDHFFGEQTERANLSPT